MYKIVNADTGKTIGTTEAPNYVVLMPKNGSYKQCSKSEAQGVFYRGVIYNLLGSATLDERAATVAVQQYDAGDDATLNAQLAVASRLYVQNTSEDVPDEQALEMPDLFKTWEEVLAAGVQLKANSIVNDGGALYRVGQAVTPQESQPPHGEGMLAVYRPIDAESHAGTLEDPIPWVYGMDCYTDKYYSYNGVTYLCKGDMIPCTWEPGSAGLWQWEAVS